MTRVDVVRHVARQMMFLNRPLIEGMYQHDWTEGSPIASFDNADPFERSQYVREAHRFLKVIAPFVPLILVTALGPCICRMEIGLPPEPLKNTNVRECQRCGGAT